MSEKTLIGRKEHADPRLNLYVFPHSGGMPGMYLQWKRLLPKVNVFGAQYPGRGSRISEPSLESIPEIVDDCLRGEQFEAPYILMGHSLGAIVAYEVSVRLAPTQKPLALIVSAMSSPEFRVIEAGADTMAEAQLIDEIAKMNPTIRADLEAAPELKDIFLRTLRADMTAADRYRQTPRAPLDVPIVFLGGKSDAIPEQEREGWRAYSASSFESYLFEGGHFYFNEDRAAFFAKLNEVIDNLCARGD
ncbi:MAG: alpha/beta fold hydrolase [Bdellovibrionota bacterium]